MTHRFAISSWLLSAALASLVHAQVCLHDADGDGHPIYSPTATRADIEFFQGHVHVASPTGVCFSDLNQDGKVDAVVANVRLGAGVTQRFYLTILRGHGDGVFDLPESPVPAAQEATAVAAADMNQDGWPDVVTANAIANTASIHFNQGDGTLGPPIEYPAGQQPRSVRIADFNNDGKPDVAVLNSGSSDVSIFLNQGNGLLSPQVRVAVPSITPRGDPNLNFAYPGPFLGVGDADRDGDIDIAVPAQQRVRLVINNGSGSFSLSPIQLFGSGSAYDTAIIDVDHDRWGDVVSLETSGFISVYRNLGTGQFAPRAQYDATNNPVPCTGCFYFAPSLCSGDFDGDAKPDLAVGHEFWRHIAVLRNRGDGTFFPKTLLPLGQVSWFVAAADLNADGRDDLACLSPWIRSRLSTLLSSPAGIPVAYELCPPNVEGNTEDRHAIAAADLDGDGDSDLVVTLRSSANPAQVKVLRNNGDGTLTDLPGVALGPLGDSTGESVAIGDLDHDGQPDLVVADAIRARGWIYPGKIWLLTNQGGLAFTPGSPIVLTGEFPLAVRLADLNRDGSLDLIAWVIEVYPESEPRPVQRRIRCFLNNGQGSFALSATCPLDTSPWFPRGDIAVGDLDGDGLPDLAATSGPAMSAGSVFVFRNIGMGQFGAPHHIPVAQHADSVQIADCNGDSQQDIIVVHDHNFPTTLQNQDAYLTVLFNASTSPFAQRVERSDPSVLTMGSSALGFALGTSEPQIVIPAAGGVLLMPIQLANPQNQTAASYAAPDSVTNVAFVDIDTDGRSDLVAPVVSISTTAILKNRKCPTPCYPNCDSSPSPPKLNVADFICFMNAFARGDAYANCDRSTSTPYLNVQDFNCFLAAFVAGCP